VTRPSPSMTAMGGEDDALARSALAGAFGPEGASWSSRSARAGGSRIPLAGAAHSGLQAAAPELAGGPLVRKRCNHNPNDHQTAENLPRFQG
jgi:hypothetical protein